MSTKSLALSSAVNPPSLLRALRLYLAERFPVPVTALLSLATGLGASAAAQQAAVEAGAPLILSGTTFGGCLMTFLFLLHLRVFDEHKDFELDAQTRPDRPVQRGVVTLAQLKVLGALAIAGQVVLALAPGLDAGWLYAVPLVYSVLMFFEFFAPDWLGSRIALYAFSHTLVMALIAWALGARVLGSTTLSVLPPALWGFLALNITAFIGVDVLRKTWAPQTEVDGLESYSKRFGIPVAAAIGIATLVASAAAGAYTGWQLGGRLGWLATVFAVTLWGIWEIRRFVGDASVKREKRLELVAGVHLLVLFIGIAIVAALQQGVAIEIGSHSFSWGL